MKVKVARKSESDEKGFIVPKVRVEPGELNIGLTVSVDKFNNISQMDYEVNGTKGSIKVARGEVMFAWSEFEKIVEELANKAPKPKEVVKPVKKAKPLPSKKIHTPELDKVFSKKPKAAR